MDKFFKVFRFEQFFTYCKKINWLLFCLISIFTIGSWLDISGVWCELPLMVEKLPERWKLPSILTITNQLGHIGPIIYLISRKFFPKVFTYANAIFAILVLGISACILLAVFWERTVFIFNEERSIYLYIFNFMFGTLDSVSSITFLPYIGSQFPKEYIIPNYIGETLSSFIPGVVSIIQGIGAQEDCFNASSNSTLFKEIKPMFSVSVYFVILAVLIVLSLTSFSIIHFSKLFNSIRKTNIKINDKRTIDLIYSDRKLIWLFMSMCFTGSFFQYGILTGLMSYSNLPYGSNILYLSVTLGNCLLPVPILLSLFSHEISVKRIIIEYIIPIFCSIYIIIMAILSPCPPFVYAKYNLGGYFMVVCWVLMPTMFLRVRCLVATKLEAYGKNYLLIYGICSQTGQMLGGIIIFVLVDILSLFKDKPKCSSYDFCLHYN